MKKLHFNHRAMQLCCLIAILVSAISMSSYFLNVEASILKDLDKASNYAKDSITNLFNKKIITGDKKGNFNPKETLSRAQIVTIIVKGLNLDTSNIPEQPTFNDVPKDHWAYKYVETAYDKGIISGMGLGRFAPKEKCTREQMASIFVNALGINKEKNEINYINTLEDNDKISDWAKKNVEITLASGIMSGTDHNVFGPKGDATKEQAAVVLDSFINNKENIINLFKADGEKKDEIKIYFNGNKAQFDGTAIIEDGIILVPHTFFDKYLFGQTSSHYYKAYKTQEWFRAHTDIYNQKGIHLQMGNKTAYVDAFSNPFSRYEKDRQPYEDKKIQLTIAPKEVNGVIFVPLEQITKIFQLDFSWDNENKIAHIQDENAPNHPDLYYTLKKVIRNGYKGELYSNMNLAIHGIDVDTNAFIKHKYKTLSNIWNYHVKEHIIISGSHYGYEEDSTEYIHTGNRYYVRDSRNNTWKKYRYNPTGLSDDSSDRVIESNLYNDLNTYSILKEDKVFLNGLSAIKYVVHLDRKQFIHLVPRQSYNFAGQILNENYADDASGVLEIYLSNEDEIVKQIFKFNEVYDHNGKKFDASIFINIDCKNIGKEIEIKAPI
ncbi:S-layer homology domain-containing protein [Anaeromicrobium sediminis]|uniref:SLH domain-containing protein n=1 Tax=Anaeromicrobium sediminis TaxID=1478221 RepID=A0A267MA93_9FIRM|nr:S-layer homology domain-containing protein [Anaeromicrobium sediminis]PAB56489.1 hypothetical protein CCE28_20685 [Anaeromicrobium sediminis]